MAGVGGGGGGSGGRGGFPTRPRVGLFFGLYAAVAGGKLSGVVGVVVVGVVDGVVGVVGAGAVGTAVGPGLGDGSGVGAGAGVGVGAGLGDGEGVGDGLGVGFGVGFGFGVGLGCGFGAGFEVDVWGDEAWCTATDGVAAGTVVRTTASWATGVAAWTGARTGRTTAVTCGAGCLTTRACVGCVAAGGAITTPLRRGCPTEVGPRTRCVPSSGTAFRPRRPTAIASGETSTAQRASRAARTATLLLLSRMAFGGARTNPALAP